MEPGGDFSCGAFACSMHDDVRHFVGCSTCGAARAEHEEGAYVGKGLSFGDDAAADGRVGGGYGVTHFVPCVVYGYPDGFIRICAQEGGHLVQCVEGCAENIRGAGLGSSVV